MKKQAPSPANEDHKKEEPRTDQAKKVPTVKDSKDPKVITDGKDDKKGIRAEEPSSDKNSKPLWTQTPRRMGRQTQTTRRS